MKLDSKIYVAGHRGMVGSAIVRELQRQGYTNIITRTHKELEPECAGRLHVRQHDTGDERHPCSMEERL